jgi:hypothetical protein
VFISRRKRGCDDTNCWIGESNLSHSVEYLDAMFYPLDALLYRDGEKLWMHKPLKKGGLKAFVAEYYHFSSYEVFLPCRL